MMALRWTTDDVARELQISRRQVTDLVAEGVLVARRDPGGRKLWFLPADVRAYVEGMPEAPRRAMGVRMVYQNAGVLRARKQGKSA